MAKGGFWGGAARKTGINPHLLPIYAMLVGLLLGVFLLGLRGIGGGALRYLFILGSVGIAWRAHKVGGLPLHAEVSIILFVFAPFLRRVVDLNAGFDPGSQMLVAPMLALVIPFGELRSLMTQRNQKLRIFAPHLIILGCILYGWALSSFQGELMLASNVAIRTVLPLLYGMCLIQRSDQSEAVIQSAARAFLVASPIMGIYGVWQFMTAPSWDAFWMLNSPALQSVGKPEPGMIRVFSTMNAPASFAAFAGCGLLLFGFCRRGWFSVLMVLPICVALLLSTVRASWISLAVGVVYCFFANSTRNRAVVLTICLGMGIAGAILLTPFGDIISSRLATLGSDPSNDGSGHERLLEYLHVYSDADRYMLGSGLAPTKPDPLLIGIDGQFIASTVALGILFGNLHVLCLIWAGVQALLQIRKGDSPLAVVAGAVVLGDLAILPLTAISAGEMGFLFWMFVGVLTARAGVVTRRARPSSDAAFV